MLKLCDIDMLGDLINLLASNDMWLCDYIHNPKSCGSVLNLRNLDMLGDMVDLLENEVLDLWRLDLLGGPVGVLVEGDFSLRTRSQFRRAG